MFARNFAQDLVFYLLQETIHMTDDLQNLIIYVNVKNQGKRKFIYCQDSAKCMGI